VNAYMPGKLFNYGAFEQIKDIYKIIIATGVMVAFLSAIKVMQNDYLVLALGIPASTIVYLVSLHVLKVGEVYELIDILKAKVNSIKQKVE